MSILDVVSVWTEWIFDVIVDNAYIRRGWYFVRYNNKTSEVRPYEIGNDIRFDAFQGIINVENMIISCSHKHPSVVATHGNDDLFM